MKTKLAFATVVVLLTLQGVSQAVVSRGRLTDEQVNAAIQRGNHDKRSHRIGLMLVDQQELFLSGLLCTTCQTSGYVITIYTPEQWIEQAARYARREMAPFTIADVPEEMREQTLHVVAMPSTPAYLNGNGFSWASSVHRVVLSDTSRAITIQPVALSHGSIETNSAFRSASFTSATVSFFMADVDRLRAADPKGEFFIVVVGDNKNKFFKVKARSMSELFPPGYANSYQQSHPLDDGQPAAAPAAEDSSAALPANSAAGKSSAAASAATAYYGHDATPKELAQLVQQRQASICTVITNPPGAEVYVDGNQGGKSPLRFVLRKRGDAFRTLTIRLDGYNTVEQRFVPDGKPIPISLALVAINSTEPGAPMQSSASTQQALVHQQETRAISATPQELFVDFRSTPTGADIRVDGAYVGTTPSSISLGAGEHIIRISKHDFLTYERTLTVTNQNLKVAAYLRQITFRFDH